MIAADTAVRAREERLSGACAAWWVAQQGRLPALLAERYLMGARGELLRSFQEALGRVGLLDRAALTGVFASWWEELRYDLKLLAARGFEGLLDNWVAAIVAAAGSPGNVSGSR